MTRLAAMPLKAKAYWYLVVTLGVCFLISSIFSSAFPARTQALIVIYTAAAIGASRLKIRLPGILVTLSMNYVVIIAALLNLGRGAGMIVGAASALAQCLIQPNERPRWYQVVFSAAGVAMAVAAADDVLQSAFLASVDPTGSLSLVTASLAYFIMNTVTVAGVIGVTAGKTVARVWRDSYLWTSPQYLVGGGIAGLLHFLSRLVGWPAFLIAIPPLYLVYRSYSVYLGRLQEQQKHIIEMSQLHLRTIETLALAIDAKDDVTAAHLRRVQVYASEIAKELRLSDSEIQALEAAALLHDVGKLAVPEYIISKPGKLTPDEFERMKVHPIVGAEILERVHFPYPVVPIVRSHHEKYDGTGYPDGLAGEEIPIGARILSAVDCLDALASDRQYRNAMPLDEAMQIVRRESGKSFDPVVVAILDRRYRELEVRAKAEAAACVRLSSGLRVERGGAPATGFALERAGSVRETTENFSLAISSARREFQLLIEITNDLGSSLSLEETLALLAVRLDKIIDHDAIAVYLLDGDKLTPRFVKGESFRLFSSLEIPLGQGLSGWVAENDLPVLNGNPTVEPGYLNDPTLVTALRSAISVPLRGPNGVVGVLTLYHLKTEAFTLDHRRILLAISERAGMAISNSLHFERARSAADMDELTGIHNARSLFRHLHREVGERVSRGGTLAVIVMDLDGFKSANDRFGHLAGNRVLQAVAKALRKDCRAGDFVARLGGDEFVMVMPEAGNRLSELLARIKQIGTTLPQETLGGIEVSVSAGAACFPNDGTDAETLLEKADERMYEAKRRNHQLRVA